MKFETHTFITLEDGWAAGMKLSREGENLRIITSNEDAHYLINGDELVSALAALGFELEPDPLAGSTLLPPGAATIAARDDAAMDPGPPAEVRMEQQTHINARKWLEVMHKGRFWTKEQAVTETVRAFQIPESVAQAIADEVWGVEIGKPPYAPEPGEGIPL